jgi:hypothetical protein
LSTPKKEAGRLRVHQRYCQKLVQETVKDDSRLAARFPDKASMGFLSSRVVSWHP